MKHDADNAVASTAGTLPSWRRSPDATTGSFEGHDHASTVSFFVVDQPTGGGPSLHRHPYSETFVVLGGRGRFEVDGRGVEAAVGDVVVAPAEAVHGFESLGPDNLRLVAIHAAPRMETTWVK
jgi:quercetin dioxygenase-like cupin family protein